MCEANMQRAPFLCLHTRTRSGRSVAPGVPEEYRCAEYEYDRGSYQPALCPEQPCPGVVAPT